MYSIEERKFYVEEILGRIFVLDKTQFDEHFSKDKEVINYLIHNVSEQFLNTNKFLIEMIVNYIKNNPIQSKSDLIMVMPLKQFLHIVKLEMNKDLSYKPKINDIEINNSNDIKEINELGNFIDDSQREIVLTKKQDTNEKTNFVSDKLTSLLAKVKNNENTPTILETKINELNDNSNIEEDKKSKLDILKDSVKSGTDLISKIINIKNDSNENNLENNIIEKESNKFNPTSIMEKITKQDTKERSFLDDIPDVIIDNEIDLDNTSIDLEIIENNNEQETINLNIIEEKKDDELDSIIENEIELDNVNYDNEIDYENINYEEYEEEEIDYGESFYNEDEEIIDFVDDVKIEETKISNIENKIIDDNEEEEIKVEEEEIVSFSFDIETEVEKIDEEDFSTKIEDTKIEFNIDLNEFNEQETINLNIIEEKKDDELDSIIENEIELDNVNYDNEIDYEEEVESNDKNEIIELNLFENNNPNIEEEKTNINEDIISFNFYNDNKEIEIEEKIEELKVEQKDILENKENSINLFLDNEIKEKIDNKNNFNFIFEEKIEELKEKEEFNFDLSFNIGNNQKVEEKIDFNFFETKKEEIDIFSDFKEKEELNLEFDVKSNDDFKLDLNLKEIENSNIIKELNLDLNIEKKEILDLKLSDSNVNLDSIESLKIKILELEKKVLRLEALEEKIEKLEKKLGILL